MSSLSPMPEDFSRWDNAIIKDIPPRIKCAMTFELVVDDPSVISIAQFLEAWLQRDPGNAVEIRKENGCPFVDLKKDGVLLNPHGVNEEYKP